METPKSSVFIGEGNDVIKLRIPHSHNQDFSVGTSEESYQARAGSGSPKNGSPTTALILEGQVPVSAKRPLGCNHNQGSPSTTGILEKDANVKPIKEALLASLRKPKCSWGLIWRKKKPDSNTSDDSISSKIILKGNPDMLSLKPTCHYCSQPYDSDLMYIQCETCPSWYHAEAVGLEEKKIIDLVGFKCCKCRKIRKPACPYSSPEYRSILDEKLQVKASKVENMVEGPCPSPVQEQQDLLPKSAEDTPHAAHDDLLPLSASQVLPQSENSQQMYYERNTAIDSSPQKLPVRRSVKRELDESIFTADDSGNAGLSTCFK